MAKKFGKFLLFTAAVGTAAAAAYYFMQKKDSAVMIGDRNYDIEGAHLAGLKAIGILWGFGNEEEFIKSNADWILKTPNDVFCLLNNEKN